MPGGAAYRSIEIETLLSSPGRIYIGQTDTLYTLPRVEGVKVYSVGDSYWYGSVTNNPSIDGMAETIRAVTGIYDLYVDGVGSTGYLDTYEISPTPNGHNTYRERLVANADMVADCDYVLIVGSVNDDDQSYADLYAEAMLTYAAVAPKPVLAVVMASGAPTSAGQTIVRNAVRDAISDSPNGWSFLDLTDLLKGSGTTASPTGMGNSDIIRAADGAHPSQTGHDIYGSLIAEWMKRVMLELGV